MRFCTAAFLARQFGIFAIAVICVRAEDDKCRGILCTGGFFGTCLGGRCRRRGRFRYRRDYGSGSQKLATRSRNLPGSDARKIAVEAVQVDARGLKTMIGGLVRELRDDGLVIMFLAFLLIPGQPPPTLAGIRNRRTPGDVYLLIRDGVWPLSAYFLIA
jgi:hypothetical protein